MYIVHSISNFYQNIYKDSFFETTIRIVGGLIAAYDVSGDCNFIKTCKDLVDKMYVKILEEV